MSSSSSSSSDGHVADLLEDEAREEQAGYEVRGVQHEEDIVPVVGPCADHPHEERSDGGAEGPRAVDDRSHRGERLGVLAEQAQTKIQGFKMKALLCPFHNQNLI